VAVVSDDSYYILKFDRDAYNSKIEEGVEITDEGVEEAFDVVAEISDRCGVIKRGFMPNNLHLLLA
jgi:coatomer subunit beta'